MTAAGNRRINEDSVGTAEFGGRYCFVVCDGLGGHGMGDAASQLVRDVFIAGSSEPGALPACLRRCFMKAQERLLAMQAAHGARNRMKTTATVLLTDGDQACVGHIGDSRLYIFRDNEVVYRTQDHSVPQALASAGQIAESEIRNHPDRSRLLRAMGSEWEKPMFELLEPAALENCQAFLLCSDGFWELIDEKEMCAALGRAPSAQMWLQDMTQTVELHGKNRNMDNFSAVAVFVTDETKEDNV